MTEEKVRADLIRLTRAETFKCFSWLTANWDSIVQEKFTYSQTVEKMRRELDLPHLLTSHLKSIVKDSGKPWLNTESRNKGNIYKHDRVRRLAAQVLYLSYIIDKLLIRLGEISIADGSEFDSQIIADIVGGKKQEEEIK